MRVYLSQIMTYPGSKTSNAPSLTLIFEHLLTFWKYKKHILCISQPSPRISYFFKKHTSFYWRMVSQVKIWVLGLLITTGVPLLLGPFSWQTKEIYMCTIPCMYTYLWIFLHVTVYEHEFILTSPTLIHYQMSSF